MARRKRDPKTHYLGFISGAELGSFLSEKYRVPVIDLGNYEILEETVRIVPKALCEKHTLVPITRAGASLIVAMIDPTNLEAIDDLKMETGYNIEPVLATDTAIRAAIDKYYRPRCTSN